MKKIVFTLCVVPFLTMPAFAGSPAAADKPTVVAQADIRLGGIGVEVGERDRYRDHDWRRYHRDRDQDWRRYHRDRAEIVIDRRRHHDRDWDRRVHR
jgi:hypothetical protein